MTSSPKLRRVIAVVVLALVASIPTHASASSHKRLIADAETCRTIAARTASPVGFGSCSGVRPGAFFQSPIGGCSFNFLFKGSDGYRYMGTAGHCLVADGVETKWAPGKGPAIEAGGRVIGRGAYGVLTNERDFGLIRLNSGVKASAQMCHFGGPTGMDTTHSSSPALIEHYGNGIAVSSVTPARTSLALNTLDPDWVTAIGVAAFGDSGSGAMRNGKALGVLVSIGASTFPTGDVFMTRLTTGVARAQQVLHSKLTLQTAPRL
jgi:hypothetical protein